MHDPVQGLRERVNAVTDQRQIAEGRSDLLTMRCRIVKLGAQIARTPPNGSAISYCFRPVTSFANKPLNRPRIANMNSGPIDGNPASALKLTKSRIHALPGPAHAVGDLLLS